VGKRDVDVLQREIIFGQFLETENIGILGCIGDPGPFCNERHTDL
jgi:hypothetical protein